MAGRWVVTRQDPIRGAYEHDGRWHVDLWLEPLRVGQALGTFVQVIETDGIPTHAMIQVRIDPVRGERGVLGG